MQSITGTTATVTVTAPPTVTTVFRIETVTLAAGTDTSWQSLMAAATMAMTATVGPVAQYVSTSATFAPPPPGLAPGAYKNGAGRKVPQKMRAPTSLVAALVLLVLTAF